MEKSASIAGLEQLENLQSEFARLLRETDPTTAVRTCPGWTVAELARHLAGVHLWAAGMAIGLDLETPDVPHGAHDREPLVRIYTDSAATLDRVLETADDDGPCLTLTGSGTPAFWVRRQIHETLIHLHDLELSRGESGVMRDPALWADGVTEVIEMFIPRQIARGRMTLPEVEASLVATDTPRRWALGAGAGSVEVRATARELDLLLWGRVRVHDLPVDAILGDRGALDRLLASRLTP